MKTRLRQLWDVLPRDARIRLIVATFISIILGLAEIAALGAVVPLLQLATTSNTSSGAVGLVARLSGTHNKHALLLVCACLLVGTFSIKAVGAIASRWWILGFIYEAEAELSTEILRYYTRAPYAFHRDRNTSSLLQTMIEAVSNTFAYVVVGLVTATSELTFLAVAFGTLIVTLPVPTVCLCLYIGFSSYVFLRVQKTRSRKYGQALRDGSIAIYRAGTQILGGIRDVLMRNSPEYLIDEFRRSRQGFSWARRRTAFVAELPRYVLEVIFMSGFGLFAVILFATTSSSAALTMLAFVVATGFRILPSAARLLAGISAMRIGMPSFDALRADLITGRSWPARRDDVSPLKMRDGIELKDLGYTFADGAVALADVNLTIPAGSSIALVGQSGAGKTTLADVIMGLHLPSTGQVLVDGRDTRDCLPEWQLSIGMVSQDVFLTDESLAQNIAFGIDPAEIDPELLRDAIQSAQLGDLVASLPAGTETPVGERGTRLSGGQRQRIGIARALYHRPEVLVLDEATSALDTETEAQIAETIDALRGRTTTIVIAHRLSTVRNCDQVALLEAGRVVAAGTFDEVAAASPAFARMIELASIATSAGDNRAI